MKKKIQNYNQSIFGGFVLGGLALGGIFTDVIYFPSKHGALHRAESEEQFFIYLGICAVLSVVFLAYGIFGRIKCKMLNKA